MKICDMFCNYHCSFDCPNIACDAFEEKYDLPCSDIGLNRIKCKDCYLNHNNTCDDCYHQNTLVCKEYHKQIQENINTNLKGKVIK